MESGIIVFDHVHLLSEHAAEAADWYVDKIGGQISSCNEVLGALQIVVVFHGANIIIRGERTGEKATQNRSLQWGINHFGFSVKGDFEEYCEALKQKGVTFTLDPTDFGPTLRIAFIEGPDGVIIELLKRM